MAPYAMAPLQPPFPTAWNFPFHVAAGIHTSILISESLVGLSVAATRQTAGRDATPRDPPPGSESPSTCAARVMVVPGSATEAKSPQDPPVPNAGERAAPIAISIAAHPPQFDL